MIILDNKSNTMNIMVLKKLVQILIYKEFEKAKSGDAINIRQILELYSESDIRNAIEDIYVNGNRLEIPEKGKSSEILRYLEFGGEDVRSLRLISRSVKKLKL